MEREIKTGKRQGHTESERGRESTRAKPVSLDASQTIWGTNSLFENWQLKIKNKNYLVFPIWKEH